MPRLRALRPRPPTKRDSSPQAEMKEEDELSNEVAEISSEEPQAKSSAGVVENKPAPATRKSASKSPEKLDNASKLYECKTCKPPKRFSYFKSYLQHCKNTHKDKGVKQEEEKVIQCTMCPFSSTKPLELESHQKVHQLKRKFFRCAKCSYVTHVRARYTKHVKYHSMPMIKCSSCDFRTPYKWNLDRHTRNHGGGGTYQCRACDFTADIRQSLTVHETNHHEPPVGQPARKNAFPFERKPRNSPKRHNQVGASDYLESAAKTLKVERKKSQHSDSEAGDLAAVESPGTMSGADCIALKCEEPGCQFITAWNSAMQRHVAETHTRTSTPNKSKKPLPMLIPLSPAGGSGQNSNQSSDNSTTLLKVPKVRVRPELAQIARDSDMAKLYGNKKVADVKRDLDFEKKNASFFDKLKERLISNSGSSPEVAINGTNELKCWCTFEAASPEELSSHKQTHHAALSVSMGVARCQNCRRCFKSTAELQSHERICGEEEEELASRSDGETSTSFRGEYTFPNQKEWEGGNTSAPVEAAGASLNVRRVFKCPNCPFWASTASRFHVHIVGHLNRKPFECSLCAYRSNWRWDITKHIKLKAARDPAHSSARVLMTDETGRRNYSKYNKYLAQMENQSNEDHGLEERGTSREPPNKLFITQKEGSLNTCRPLPALKAAIGQGKSLLKRKPARQQISSQNKVDETKRRFWKCKRCNFRDSSKDVVVQHLKMHYEVMGTVTVEKNSFTCSDCPFTAQDATNLALHRVHHRPNLEAIFKCYLCPYYVSTKGELLEHARLHGEELAVVHQKNMDFDVVPSKSPRKSTKSDAKEDSDVHEVEAISPTPSADSNPRAKLVEAPPFLLDTRALAEAPLVWVTRPNNTLAKMLKCRHCPYISSRRADVIEHESMHTTTQGQGPAIGCAHCSFVCSRRDVMDTHAEMHAGALGTVHCLVDETRADVQQVADLAALLGLSRAPPIGPEPDLADTRLVHCCAKCPARFLCEKELRIHLRYHSTELAYTCQWCSYAARQPAHLLAHHKAHSPEYQERTKYLLSVYGFSQRHPPPATACVEADSQSNENGATAVNGVAWVVVDNSSSTAVNNLDLISCKSSNQVYTCTKCPARYFKLDALEYHMTLHGSNNRFKCHECDYSSKTAQNLDKHKVVHRRQGETSSGNITPVDSTATPSPATSPGPAINLKSGNNCDQDFPFMYGNPNFVYPGYVRNGRLKEKRYKCHKCPSAFEKREQYRVHLTLHGAKQRYRCEICDYSVKYYANYAQHVKKHEANAQAQASNRMLEGEKSVNGSPSSVPVRSAKSLKKQQQPSANLVDSVVQSTQDRQTALLLRKRRLDPEVEGARCPSCPYSATDKESLDVHKRRHGIERLTPSCPHCDYVPRKEENVGEHIKLHFTRLYKPESYVIVELLSLKMKKILQSGEELDELLFEELEDGNFKPPANLNFSAALPAKEKLIVDPNTGETKRRVPS